MLKQIFDPILSKLGELIVACAHTNLSSDIKLILKAMQKDLKSLSAKASDVEEEIKNAEQSGRKKRKREVEEWLVDVKSIESEVAELVNEVEPAGFIRRMMGVGKATRLNEELRKLVDQSRHFGELLLDVRCTTREALAATRSQVEHKSSLGQNLHVTAKTTMLMLPNSPSTPELLENCSKLLTLPNLNKIIIHSSNLSNTTIEELLQGLCMLPNLRSLSLCPSNLEIGGQDYMECY